jgi:hypothetical protein
MNKHKIKQKRKLLREKVDKKYIGFHVYRSVNENLPSVFGAINGRADQDGNFNDPTAEIGQRYYYNSRRLTPTAMKASLLRRRPLLQTTRAIATHKTARRFCRLQYVSLR